MSEPLDDARPSEPDEPVDGSPLEGEGAGEEATAAEGEAEETEGAATPPPTRETPSEAESDSSAPPWLGLPGGVVVGLLVLWALAFGGGVADMVGHWFAPKSYYAHGPLVPLVAAWMIWRDREALLAVPREPSFGGLWLLVPAVLATAIGHLEDIKVILNLSLLASLYGLVWVVLGRRVLLRAWVPALFLLFMVPLPGFVIDRLTFGLKMLAAKLSVVSIHVAGIPAVLDGGTIHLAETDVLVDDVCSGLKTMVALIGFSVVFAYLQRTRVKSLLILLLAVPVSIVANVVRILILCWLAAIGSKAAFEGPLHEATGLLVYALALILFLLVQALPLPGDEPAPEDAGDGAPEDGAEPAPAPEQALPPAEPVPPARGHWISAFAAGGLAGLIALVSAATSASAGPVGDTQVTASIPARIGAWESTEVRLTEEVYQVLGTRDAMFRRYSRSSSATTVDLYVTHAAGDIFRVAHPPERCFGGGGYTEQARRVIEITLGGRTLSVNRILFRKDTEQVLVYYWYRLNGKDVAAYTQYRFGSLLRRLQRYDSSGSMIRLSTTIDGRGEEAAEARLRRFVSEALGAALEPIGD